jgi:hypothetical protein
MLFLRLTRSHLSVPLVVRAYLPVRTASAVSLIMCLASCGSGSTSGTSHTLGTCGAFVAVVLYDPVPGSQVASEPVNVTIAAASQLFDASSAVALQAVDPSTHLPISNPQSPAPLVGPIEPPTPIPTATPTPAPTPTPSPSVRRPPPSPSPSPTATPSAIPLPFASPIFYQAAGLSTVPGDTYLVNLTSLNADCTASPIAGGYFSTYATAASVARKVAR